MEWCEANDCIPVFDDFVYEVDKNGKTVLDENGNKIFNENYYKLLIDFTVYDESGTYAPQTDVTMTFPEEGDAFGSMTELIREGLEDDAIIEAKRAEKLPTILEEIEEMNKPREQMSVPIDDDVSQKQIFLDKAKTISYIKDNYNVSEEEAENVERQLQSIIESSGRRQLFSDRRRGKKSTRQLVDRRHRLDGLQRETKNGTIRTIAVGISNEFVKKGFIDFRGIKLSTNADEAAEQLATFAMIARNPQFETNRIIYVKGTEVVGSEAVTSFLVGSSKISKTKNLKTSLFDSIEDRMKRLGADGFYDLHNHPSGDPKPSGDAGDLGISRKLYAGFGDKFKGGIVIDHNKYSYISSPDNTPRNVGFETLNIYAETASPNFYEGKGIIDHPLLYLSVSNSDDVARIASQLTHSNNYSTLIFTNKDGVRAIQEVHNNFVDSSDFKNFVANRKRDFGGRSAFLVTDNVHVFGSSLVKTAFSHNVLRDVLYVDSTGAQAEPSYQESGLRPDSDRLSNGRLSAETATYRVGEDNSNYKSSVNIDADYMSAINRGDIDTVRRMVEQRAVEKGFTNAVPEQTLSYKMRTGRPPQKTKKVYKVFTVDELGRPSALFVSGVDPLPQNVWLDAQDTWHFENTRNGRFYVPSTKNPNTEGGKTGGLISKSEISDADWQELVKRGFVKQNSKSVTALAYRPGWHAGDIPFFPQGGTKAEGSNYENIHRFNQVVFECEMAYDIDYTKTHPTKDGLVAFEDMQELPENGGYEFATNPMARAEDIGKWFISSSLKIGRALTEEECNEILQSNGRLPQEWQASEYREKGRGKNKTTKLVGVDKTIGHLDLEKLGYTGEQFDAARKTLAPVTYDDNGNVIPLSERFNAENEDIRYSLDMDEAETENMIPKDIGDVLKQGKEALKGLSLSNRTINSIYNKTFSGLHLDYSDTSAKQFIANVAAFLQSEDRIILVDNNNRANIPNGGQHILLTALSPSALNQNLAQFKDEIKNFKSTNNIQYAIPLDESENMIPKDIGEVLKQGKEALKGVTLSNTEYFVELLGVC